MGTVYSGQTWTGSYTYTRVKVDYNNGNATAYLLHSRTNSWSGTESAWNCVFAFGGQSTTFSTSVSGYHTDTVIASVSFTYNNNTGGTYTGYTNSDAGTFYFSGGVYIPAGTYTVSYNANGGTGAPASQTKYPGTNLTLSSTIPTKSPTTVNSYTITFNAGEGTAQYTTYTPTDTTTYDCWCWNTKQDGTGSGYQFGGIYGTDASVTMYAQYHSTTTKGGVVLPTAERYGYTLQGWTRDLTTGVLVSDNYIPTKNETLYAVWQIMVPDNPYTTSTALDNLEITSTSTSDITPFTGTISCVASLPIVRQLLYSFSNDNGTTWTNYQSSNSYNFTGLHEETEYTCRIRVKAVHQGVDSEDLIVTSNPFTFTTLADQAKLRRMINGQWKKGKAFYKVNGQWVKAKKVYILIDGQWKININNE